MAKLAIVSSYNENCGNASYTHALRMAFSSHVEVDVLPLDLFVLQRKGRALREFGDEHIKAMAERLKQYDYVNIQFEAGLFGATNADILRRVTWLIEAAPNLIFTMHRVDVPEREWKNVFLTALSRLSIKYYLREVKRLKQPKLYRRVVDACNEASKKKNVWICVHTKRERRVVQEFMKFKNTFDFPLGFLNPQERASVIGSNNRDAFIQRHRFPEDKKIVGAFGYLSNYKGLETLIQSLARLPDDYMIALFGSQHPQTVKPHVQLDTYLASLIQRIERESARTVQRNASLGEVLPPTRDLMNRIRFMGNIPDPEFIEALRWCDATVLPYVEVGQSMSGVIVLGLECNARMFCSNNLSFFETRRYFGETYFTFDIGNHIELAQKIQFSDKDFSLERDRAFERYNISHSAALHLTKFGFLPATTESPARVH